MLFVNCDLEVRSHCDLEVRLRCSRQGSSSEEGQEEGVPETPLARPTAKSPELPSAGFSPGSIPSTSKMMPAAAKRPASYCLPMPWRSSTAGQATPRCSPAVHTTPGRSTAGHATPGQSSPRPSKGQEEKLGDYQLLLAKLLLTTATGIPVLH